MGGFMGYQFNSLTLIKIFEGRLVDRADKKLECSDITK